MSSSYQREDFAQWWPQYLQRNFSAAQRDKIQASAEVKALLELEDMHGLERVTAELTSVVSPKGIKKVKAISKARKMVNEIVKPVEVDCRMRGWESKAAEALKKG